MASEITVVLRRNLIKALRLGNLEEAAEILARLQGEDPLALETQGLHLELLLRQGRLADAATLSARLVDQHPGSARIRFLAGQLAAAERDYAGAAIHLRESLRIHPSWRTERRLGQVLTHGGRFEEAEAILLRLVEGHEEVRQDLAWLAERRGDDAGAIRHLEAVVTAQPEHAYARENLRRLKARALDPGELQSEVEGLLALGEAVPEELVPEYVESLLRTGKGDRARASLETLLPSLSARAVQRTAWAAYKLQALDIAVDLFLKCFPDVQRTPTFFSALESAALRTHRSGELFRLYQQHAPSDRRLFGRMRALSRRLPKE